MSKRITLRNVSISKEAYRYLVDVENATEDGEIETTEHCKELLKSLQTASKAESIRRKNCHRIFLKKRCQRGDDGYCLSCHAARY